MIGLLFLTKAIQLIVILVALVFGLYGLVWVLMRLSRQFFDYAGQTQRDWLRWLFTPKNFFTCLPSALVFVLICIVLLFAYATFR